MIRINGMSCSNWRSLSLRSTKPRGMIFSVKHKCLWGTSGIKPRIQKIGNSRAMRFMHRRRAAQLYKPKRVNLPFVCLFVLIEFVHIEWCWLLWNHIFFSPSTNSHVIFSGNTIKTHLKWFHKYLGISLTNQVDIWNDQNELVDLLRLPW